jgi:hypothetical protein
MSGPDIVIRIGMLAGGVNGSAKYPAVPQIRDSGVAPPNFSTIHSFVLCDNSNQVVGARRQTKFKSISSNNSYLKSTVS